MKIAYIVSNYGEISETFTRDLANGFVKEKHSVMILCNKNKNQNLYSNSHQFDDIQELNFYETSSLTLKIINRLNYFWMKKEQLKQKSFDNLQIKVTKKLLPSLKKYQPDVAFIDFGVVAVQAQLALEQLNIPFFVHFHGFDITKKLNDKSYRNALPRLFENASGLIVASHHIKRLLVLEGANLEKIKIVRLGVNLENIIPLPWTERQKLSPSIAFLGRFTEKKHPLALIEAFNLVIKKISNAQLTMIGDGEEMERVKQRIKKLNLLKSVKLYGALPHQKALEIVNQHWLLAQHSVTSLNGDQEGFAISLAEGALLELPIVATWHNGIPEQVIDGKTGFLVKEFDYETMAERIIELLSNPDLAQHMGKAGRKNITQICNTERRVNEILDILVKNI